MPTASILGDKYKAAGLPQLCAPRSALVKKIQKAADRRIVVLSAPAGFGKTVSAQLWLKSAGRRYIWIGLDEYDDALTLFCRLLCNGLFSLQPKNRAMAEVLASPSFNTAPVEHTIALLLAFLPDGQPYALVLDDFHFIRSKEIRKAMLMLQKRLPGSFVTLLLTREEVNSDYVDPADTERYAFITAADLAFGPGEIQKYFQRQGHAISATEAETVHAATGGWAMGVHALSIGGMAAGGTAGGQVFEQYIKTQLWDKLSEELRHFLLCTGITGEISPRLANRLSGREDSQEVLEDLCRHNFFVSRVSADTYRYHRLFLDFLRSLLDKGDANFVRSRYRVAAAYYLEENQIFRARQCAFRSRDEKAIAQTSYAMADNGENPAGLSVEEFVDMIRQTLLDTEPEELCSTYPYLYAQLTGYYFLIGDAARAEHCLDMLYQNLPVIRRDYPEFLADAALIAFVDPRPDMKGLIKRYTQFPNLQNLNGRLQWSTLTLHLPFAHRSGRDFSALADGVFLKLYTPLLRPLLGEPLSLLLPLTRAGLLYEQNALPKAMKILREAQDAITAQTSNELVFCCHVQTAALQAALCDEAQLTDALAHADSFVRQPENGHFVPNLKAFKIRLALRDADRAAARAWLDNTYIVESEELALYKTYQCLTTVRACMVLGRGAEAARSIEQLRQRFTAFARPLDLAETGVLHAVLEWALGQKKKAAALLADVLVSLQPHGFVRVVADEGAAVLPILKHLANTAQKGSCGAHIDTRFLKRLTFAAYEQSTRHVGVAHHLHPVKLKLSKQQKLVLGLLAEGYKNAEIAEKTGLTIHTVKFHLSAAYKKLGADNAMEALRKVRERNLLE